MMEKNQFLGSGSRIKGAAVPLLAAVIACSPILAGGFPKGHDWDFELVRVAEYGHSLVAGQLPPFWAENLYGGYGSPVFLFYAPLFSAAASLFSWFLHSVSDGVSAAIILFAFCSVVATKMMMEGVVRDDSPAGRAAVRVSIYLYVLSPYLIGNIILRNANAEFAALCMAPLALAGLLTIGEKPRRGFLLLASGFALVVLAHSITALVVAAMIVAGGAVLNLFPARGREGGLTVLAVVLGLALSAFFWAPALSLVSLVQPEQLTEGYFDYRNHFPGMITPFTYEPYFAVGLLAPFTLLGALGAAFLRRPDGSRSRATLILALCGTAALLFLQQRASSFLWERIPLLPVLQFPWRLMGPLSLCVAIAGGMAFQTLFRNGSARIIGAAEAVMALLCLFNAVPHLVAYEPLERSVVSQLPKMLTPEALRESEVAVTFLDEYLPRGAVEETWRLQRPAAGGIVRAEPPVRVSAQREGGTHLVLEVEAEGPSLLRMGRWAFPGWEVRLDGRKGEAVPNRFGSFDMAVPRGKSVVTLRLRPPPVRRFSLSVSLAAFVLLCGLLGRPGRLWKRFSGLP